MLCLALMSSSSESVWVIKLSLCMYKSSLSPKKHPQDLQNTFQSSKWASIGLSFELASVRYNFLLNKTQVRWVSSAYFLSCLAWHDWSKHPSLTSNISSSFAFLRASFLCRIILKAITFVNSLDLFRNHILWISEKLFTVKSKRSSTLSAVVRDSSQQQCNVLCFDTCTYNNKSTNNWCTFFCIIIFAQEKLENIYHVNTNVSSSELKI